MLSKLRRQLGSVRNRLTGSLVGVRTQERVVALTFDDGPHPCFTPLLLDLLASHGAKATFFAVGSLAEKNPTLIRRIAHEGHEIGNHSWDHPSFPLVSSAEIRSQIVRTRKVLPPQSRLFMRPTFGHQSLRSYAIARLLGHEVVGWNLSGEDWLGQDAQRLFERLSNSIRPGAIILLHDNLFQAPDDVSRDRAPTISAVDALLSRFSEYRFVTLSELLENGEAIRRPWFVAPDRSFLKRLRVDSG
jgi:peptidoglycan-N-acetylglucosamine deacetylase